MKKRLYLSGVVLLVGIMAGWGMSYAGEKVPMADSSKMMMEHIDMDCTICHGADGPKGVKMMNHPKQKCSDCHTQGSSAKPLTHKESRTALSHEMMLKHGAALNCKLCHGDTGPKGMMLEHMGMDCQTCHVVEGR